MRRRLALLVPPLVVLAGCGSGSGSSSAGGPAATASPGSAAAPALSQHAAHDTAAFPNWLNFHRDPAKTGHVGAGPAKPLHRAWTDHLDGSVWSEPVVAAGTLIAATEDDSVYGLNPKNGKQLWRTHLGTPEPLSHQPCGDIDPIGITGSPAVDLATKSVFAVATTGHGTHTMWALNIANGRKRWHRNVDVDSSRDRNAEQQRAALLVVDKRVIVTYGAHSGDCGNYVGYAASVATNGKGPIPFYAVPNQRGAGMWGAAGPVRAYDGNILTPTANGSKFSGKKWDHSDGVIELSPSMHYVRGWAPKDWKRGNRDDLSLGSTSPAAVDRKYVVGGKRGTVWLLKPSLGGVDGQLDSVSGCHAFGGIAAAGHLVVLPCKYPSPSMLAVKVHGRHLHKAWRTGGLYGSPVIGGHRVYLPDLGSGSLKVLSRASGKVIASIQVGSLPTFPSLVVDGSRVFVPTLSGVTAVKGS
jgi:outer membrane protein assembly factor BamB